MLNHDRSPLLRPHSLLPRHPPRKITQNTTQHPFPQTTSPLQTKRNPHPRGLIANHTQTNMITLYNHFIHNQYYRFNSDPSMKIISTLRANFSNLSLKDLKKTKLTQLNDRSLLILHGSDCHKYIHHNQINPRTRHQWCQGNQINPSTKRKISKNSTIHTLPTSQRKNSHRRLPLPTTTLRRRKTSLLQTITMARCPQNS